MSRGGGQVKDLKCTKCGLGAESRFGVEGRTHHCGGTFERIGAATEEEDELDDLEAMGFAVAQEKAEWRLGCTGGIPGPDDDRDDTNSGQCHHGVGFDEPCDLCEVEADNGPRL